jgi:hypothetical protein
LKEAERPARVYVSADNIRAYELRNGIEDLKGKYHRARKASWQRRIEWLFNMKTWMEVWDGKISKRGRKPRDLCMCRHNDEGPYAPWNVRIATGYENKLDWWEKKPKWFKHQGNFQGPRETRSLISEFESLARRANLPLK